MKNFKITLFTVAALLVALHINAQGTKYSEDAISVSNPVRLTGLTTTAPAKKEASAAEQKALADKAAADRASTARVYKQEELRSVNAAPGNKNVAKVSPVQTEQPAAKAEVHYGPKARPTGVQKPYSGSNAASFKHPEPHKQVGVKAPQSHVN